MDRKPLLYGAAYYPELWDEGGDPPRYPGDEGTQLLACCAWGNSPGPDGTKAGGECDFLFS